MLTGYQPQHDDTYGTLNQLFAFKALTFQILRMLGTSWRIQ